MANNNSEGSSAKGSNKRLVCGGKLHQASRYEHVISSSGPYFVISAWTNTLPDNLVLSNVQPCVEHHTEPRRLRNRTLFFFFFRASHPFTTSMTVNWGGICHVCVTSWNVLLCYYLPHYLWMQNSLSVLKLLFCQPFLLSPAHQVQKSQIITLEYRSLCSFSFLLRGSLRLHWSCRFSLSSPSHRTSSLTQLFYSGDEMTFYLMLEFCSEI